MNNASGIFERFLRLNGQKFDVERVGIIIETYDGLPNTSSNGEKYIGFRPGSDIKPGDWLINRVKERFYVKDTTTDFQSGKPFQLKIYYDTEVEHNSQTTSNVYYNIETVNNSAIGNYNTVSVSYTESLSALKNKVQNSNSADKEELQEIITLLEMIVDNKVPASKGILSKFSEVMERNSWITGSIMSTLLGWLTSHI